MKFQKDFSQDQILSGILNIYTKNLITITKNGRTPAYNALLSVNNDYKIVIDTKEQRLDYENRVLDLWKYFVYSKIENSHCTIIVFETVIFAEYNRW